MLCDNDESQDMLLMKENIWKWVSVENEQVLEEICLWDWSNWSDDEIVDSDSSDWFDTNRNWWSLHSILNKFSWSDWSDWLLKLIWNKIYVKNAGWFDRELEFSLKWWMILMRLLLMSD